MNSGAMKKRTKDFAKAIITLCRQLPNDREGRLIGNLLFRSGTSVAANYRAACRARSKLEFIATIGIVEEEADETLFWLELIHDQQIIKFPKLAEIMTEANEILSMVVTSIRTAKRNK